MAGDKKTIRIVLGGGLKSGPVHVWKSNATEQFTALAPMQLKNNTLECELEPDSLYTFTSTSGQQKGAHGTPPESKPFPFPFTENFDGYRSGDTPRYFSDQKGTFEVAQGPQGGLCLAQIDRFIFETVRPDDYQSAMTKGLGNLLAVL